MNGPAALRETLAVDAFPSRSYLSGNPKVLIFAAPGCRVATLHPKFGGFERNRAACRFCAKRH